MACPIAATACSICSLSGWFGEGADGGGAGGGGLAAINTKLSGHKSLIEETRRGDTTAISAGRRPYDRPTGKRLCPVISGAVGTRNCHDVVTRRARHRRTHCDDGDDHPRSEPIAETLGNTSGHDHADCKSVGLRGRTQSDYRDPRVAPAGQNGANGSDLLLQGLQMARARPV
jgi:hypothetical protein